MRDNLARLILSRQLVGADARVLWDEDRTLSRAGLIAAVGASAQAFRTAGVRPDDYVIVLCGRGIGFWVDLLALWTIGAKTVCVEHDIAADHGTNILALIDARWVRHQGRDCPECFAALPALEPDATPAPDTDPHLAFDALPFADDADMPDLAAIIFTSGTTGLPKAVPLTHRALIVNALATAERLAIGRDQRLMIATPFRFISSISHFVVTLLSGSALFGVERTVMIKELIDLMHAHAITAFGGSPFHLQFIAMTGSAKLPDLRWAMSSGDHLRPDVIAKLRAAFPELVLHVVYGMAELGGRFCMLPPEDLDAHAGSVGFPINGLELAILDETGAPAPQGEIGEIHARGHLAFDGYVNNAKANAEALTPHGFRTGDKGYRDPEGRVYLAGRSDAVFKRAGLKVSALTVLEAVMALEAVDDAHVGSEEDPVEGRVPVAFVKLAREAADSDLLAGLRATGLATNHLPKRFVRLETIPRTGSGKVDRRRLKALAGMD